MSPSIVSQKKMNELRKRMEDLGITEEDMDEQFVRASGPGGQKVNKTASCVVLHHKPTGIVVKCMETRSRELNRFLARRRMVDRIASTLHEIKSEERKKIEKIRRQKRRRSKRAKEKILANKRMTAEKKQTRRAIPPQESD